MQRILQMQFAAKVWAKSGTKKHNCTKQEKLQPTWLPEPFRLSNKSWMEVSRRKPKYDSPLPKTLQGISICADQFTFMRRQWWAQQSSGRKWIERKWRSWDRYPPYDEKSYKSRTIGWKAVFLRLYLFFEDAVELWSHRHWNWQWRTLILCWN